jgi:formylglycine-generating enzyme required for sulfatase activity
VLALTAVLLVRWLDDRRLLERERRLSELDLGRFELTIELFDWRVDPESHAVARTPVDPAELPALAWSLSDPDADDPDAPGPPIAAPRFRHGVPQRRGGTVVEADIEARGGAAFVLVSGRGRSGEHCPASVIPVRRLPGHDRYETPRQIRVVVPTCRATRFDTVTVPEGPFVAGGFGDPPSHFTAAELAPEHVVQLPGFAIDRTEVTNAAFEVFATMVDVHGITAPEHSDALAVARGPNYPRININWFDARAYCRFLGKDLPTSHQWQKALRGGRPLPDRPNPAPTRNTPWVSSDLPAWQLAHIAPDAAFPVEGSGFGRAGDVRRPAPVGTYPQDRSPYGVLDLAGNVQEWTLDPEPDTDKVPLLLRSRITRGGNWFNTSAATLVDFMATENPRSPWGQELFQGSRCALPIP